ncbi:hypothetical protein V3C99_001834 [Haemonchus contortus]
MAVLLVVYCRVFSEVLAAVTAGMVGSDMADVVLIRFSTTGRAAIITSMIVASNWKPGLLFLSSSSVLVFSSAFVDA